MALAGFLPGLGWAAAPPGPQTAPVDAARYASTLHVDPARGDDAAGDGTVAHPFASLAIALERAAPAAGQRAAVLLAQGRYREPTFALKPRVDLFGGFASPGGARDVLKFPTVLDGDGVQRIAFGANDALVDGVHFTNGRVHGKGAALLCDGTSPTLRHCVFADNRTVLPQPWTPAQLHLTAHDGGAVMCLNGASPQFDHCLFYNNVTECGRGGALACDRGATPQITACVFANNRAGIDDPMRSSDGGAVSYFDHSGGEFAGNVVVANSALTRNDAGGVFVALWSAPKISDTLIVGNDSGDDAGGLFVGGQEHRYGVPLDTYPAADRYQVVVERCVFFGNVNGSRNSGAMRVTMESRVRFTDNVIAENAGGFYLQRSEITAERNTVWQDWKFVEDKPSLGPSRLAGNILRGPLDPPIEARATLAHNMVEPAAGGTDSLAVADVFLTDGVAGRITKVRFDAATFTTVLALAEPLPGGTRATGRPVRVGQAKSGQWRVVKSGSDRELVLWGRLEATTKAPSEFELARTFTLKPDAPSGLGARVRP